MGEAPDSFVNKKTLSRAGLAGAVLGVLGISSFLGLWLLLGALGVDTFARLVVAVCAPPGLLTILIGVYALMNQPGKSQD